MDTCEVHLDWTESTGDFDPQFVIEYEVYVNGEVDHSLALRFTRTSVYATRDGVNTFAVAAVEDPTTWSARNLHARVDPLTAPPGAKETRA